MLAKLGDTQKPYQVLLLMSNQKEVEFLRELIDEVAACRIDVHSHHDPDNETVLWSHYQVVIVDSSVTGSVDSSIELLERIRRISPSTSVILLSHEARIDQAVAAIRLGAEDFLQKPFNSDVFQLDLKRALDRKEVFAESTKASGFLYLIHTCQLISSSLDQRSVFEIIKNYLKRELNSSYAAVYALKEGVLYHTDRKGTYLKPGEKNSPTNSASPDEAMDEILAIALQASGILGAIEDVDISRFVERGNLTPALFLFRFKCVGKSDYFCVCLGPNENKSSEDFDIQLRMLKAQIEVTGKNIGHYQGVQHLAYIDDVTGLFNTRYLNSALDREIRRYVSTKKSFGVLFVDLDKFKSVNDSHGHVVGSKLLKDLGALVRKTLRDTDTVVRYGGDEFVVLLPDCTLEKAKDIAERIRLLVEENIFKTKEGKEFRLTVSIGVALFPTHARSKQEVIAAADHAMYESKRGNRNCVMIAEIPKKLQNKLKEVK